MNQLTLRQKLVIVAIPVLLIAAMVLLALSSSRFKVTATDPGQNGKIPSYGVLILTYSNAPNADQASITASPNFTLSKKVTGNKLVLTPADPLTDHGDYTVQVNKVCNKDHTGSCTDFTLHFSIDNSLTYQGLSKDQQQQVTAQTDSQYQTTPLLAILPVHDNPDFLIDARPSANFMYIVITPNVTADALTPDEYSATYSKFYQEGKDYLTSRGYSLQTANYKVMSDQEFNALTSSGD